MALTTEKKAEILKEYGLHETDTGSPEAQVCPADLPHQYLDRAPEVPQARSPLPSWSVADGWSPSWPAEVPG